MPFPTTASIAASSTSRSNHSALSASSPSSSNSVSPPPGQVPPTSSDPLRLYSRPQPRSYQAQDTTPRTSVSSQNRTSRAVGKSRSYYEDQESTTSTDDFLEDDPDDDEDYNDREAGAKRPFLPKRSTSASSVSRSLSAKQRRTNSIKMKRSNSRGLRSSASHSGEIDDETAAKRSRKDDVYAHTSTPTSNHTTGGEATKSPHDLTFDDIFDPTKTLKENKSMMISAELDRMGMGRYQVCIWFLCGCGYFIDLLWAQALGLIATQVAYEFSDQLPGGTSTGNLSVAFSTGLTVGAFFFGFAVDVLGRKWSFYLTTFIAAVFGIASGGANSFDTLCVLAAFIGFGIGGNIPIDATITLEFLPTNRRFLVAALSIFQPLGVLVCCGVAYGLVPRYACDSAATCTRSNNMGWRYTLYTLGCITWLIFVARFFVFSFRESPQYLLARGNDAKALQVIQQIYKTNGGKMQPLFTISDFREAAKRIASIEGRTYVEESDDDQEGLTASAKRTTRMEVAKKSAREMLGLFLNAKTLFQNRTMARVTTIIWITFIADFWGFTLAGYYLPQILRAKGAEEDTSISTTYRNYILIYFPGIFAVAFGSAMIEVPRLGRQWAMVISSALMAVSMFLFTVVETQAGSIGFNAMEYFFQSFFNSILYAFVPEIYPSQVRGTASGLASTLGRVASIVAPLAADPLYRDGTEQQAKHVLYLAGSLTLLCPIALAFLPYDTRGMRVY